MAAAHYGVVFKLDAAGNETVLFSFSAISDGTYPVSSLVLDSAGNLYGTAKSGGAEPDGGVVFKLDPTGHETVLHMFKPSGGCLPKAGLVFDSDGNLYGTTSDCGQGKSGTVYKLDKAGHETVLCYTASRAARTGLSRGEEWYSTQPATCTDLPRLAEFRMGA